MSKRKDYKEIFTQGEMHKRGQITIFVIVAIVIVVVGILIYFFVPQVRTVFQGELVPNTFVEACIGPTILSGVETLSAQGGYANPEGSIMYLGNDIKYLCYTAQYFLPCRVQQPMIKQHFEQELATIIENKAEECVSHLRDEYESRGYTVSPSTDVNARVEIIPGVIHVVIDAPLTVSQETTQNFEEFSVETQSSMYDLLMISTSVIDFESTYGDSSTDLFTANYPNLRIYKNKLGDGTTIYTVEDVTTKESFIFASRSLAWDGGLGLSG